MSVFPGGDPGDWRCNSCGNQNWARRRECNRCKAPKPRFGPDGQDLREDPREDLRGGLPTAPSDMPRSFGGGGGGPSGMMGGGGGVPRPPPGIDGYGMPGNARRDDVVNSRTDGTDVIACDTYKPAGGARGSSRCMAVGLDPVGGYGTAGRNAKRTGDGGGFREIDDEVEARPHTSCTPTPCTFHAVHC